MVTELARQPRPPMATLSTPTPTPTPARSAGTAATRNDSVAGAWQIPRCVVEALAAAGISVGERMGPHTHRDGGGTYRARYADGRDIALSLAPPDPLLPTPPRSRRTPSGSSQRAGWYQRGVALARLRHPHLAGAQEVLALPRGWVGLSTTLLDGVELNKLIAWHGFLTRAETAQVVSDIAAGLAALHAEGLSHGDVSPTNVMVGVDGRCVLVDLLGRPGERGTEPWAAPETRMVDSQAENDPDTAREGERGPLERWGSPADVYALARLALTCVGASSVLADEVEPVLRQALDPDPASRVAVWQVSEALAALDGIRPPSVPAGLWSGVPDWFAPSRTPTVRPLTPRPGPRQSPGEQALASRRRTFPASRHGNVPASRRGSRRAHSRLSSAWRTGGRVAGILFVVVGGVVVGVRSLDGVVERQPLATGAMSTASLTDAANPLAFGTQQPTPPRDPGSTTVTALPLIPPSDVPSPATEVTDRAARDPDSRIDVTPGEAVRQLLAQRDAALSDGDARALESVAVPGSPAAEADAELLAALEKDGQTVHGLRTSVLRVSEQGREPNGRVLVEVVLRQEAHRRVGRDGRTRQVPAQPERRVVVVLEPGPWRMAEIRQAGSR